MRKGAVILLAVFLATSVFWLALGYVVAKQLCAFVQSSLPVMPSPPACTVQLGLVPSATVLKFESPAFNLGSEQQASVAVERVELAPDVFASVADAGVRVRVRIHQPEIRLLRASAGEAVGVANLARYAAALPAGVDLLWGLPVSSFTIEKGGLAAIDVDHNREKTLLLRDIRATFHRDARAGATIEFQGSGLPNGGTLLFQMNLQRRESGLDMGATGALRGWNGIFFTLDKLQLRYSPEQVELRRLEGRLNSAPIDVSGTVPLRGEAPLELSIHVRRLRIGPLVDHFWLDMRGALSGELDLEARLVRQPASSSPEEAEWALDGSVEARELQWAGVNLLYGLLERVQSRIAPEGNGLPRDVRLQFAEELMPAATKIATASAALKFRGTQLEVGRAELRAPRFRIVGSGTFSLQDGVHVRSTFQLEIARELAHALCTNEPRICTLVPAGKSAAFTYVWNGKLGETLPAWQSSPEL
jgi:hypothetical protein